MTPARITFNPNTLMGLSLLVFGGWLALEGAGMKSGGQLVIAGAFIFVGWWCRRNGSNGDRSGERAIVPKWIHFYYLATPVSVAVYVMGYFVLMDRGTPTSPLGGQKQFESSLRWASNEWMTKTTQPYETPWRASTTWNILYQPMDRIWFHYNPRSEQEQEELQVKGYYR